MAATSIPRFLLPQSGLIWRRANLGHRLRNYEAIVRHASSTSSGGGSGAKDKPLVLEKPTKFNPPSHGARLPRKNRPQPQHYGGALPDEEVASQKQRNYPGLPPPKGTWAYRWLMTKFWVHFFIALSPLTGLALYTAVENFKLATPFDDLLPTNEDYLKHPIDAFWAHYEVWRLNTLYESAKVAERRKHDADDITKRSRYRKAHGLEGPGGGWTSRDEPSIEMLWGPGGPNYGKPLPEKIPDPKDEEEAPKPEPEPEKQPRRKILGLF